MIDHLPGGALRSLPDDHARMAAAAPKDNVPCEEAFAGLDSIVRSKPNMRDVARETYVLFKQNGTSEWLREKSQQEQDAMMTRARQMAKKVEAQAKADTQAIRLAQQHRQQSRIAQDQLKKATKERVLRDLINSVHDYGGLWLTVADMCQHLQDMPEQLQEQAVTAQLRLQKAMSKCY